MSCLFANHKTVNSSHNPIEWQEKSRNEKAKQLGQNDEDFCPLLPFCSKCKIWYQTTQLTLNAAIHQWINLQGMRTSDIQKL